MISGNIDTMDKKFRLIDRRSVRHPLGAEQVNVWRVQALVDIPLHNVRAGEMGGWIDKSSKLSDEGNSWVGNSSFALDGSEVSGDALLSGAAVISGTILQGNATVTGSARINVVPGVKRRSIVSHHSYVGGFARLSNTVVSWGARIEDAAIISDSDIDGGICRIGGFAKIHASTVKNSKVYGKAVIQAKSYIVNSSIHCSALVRGGTGIENCEVYGDANIDYAYKGSGYDHTGKHSKAGHIQCYFEDNKIDDCHDIYTMSKVNKNVYSCLTGVELGFIYETRKATKEKEAAKTLTSVKKDAMDVSQFEAIETEYAKYETDIVKIIKYPMMCDLTDPFTARFHSILRTVRRAVSNVDIVSYKENIFALEDAYYAAESNARKIANSMFNDVDKGKIADAKQMLAITMDKAASETEKKNALRGALRNLEGRIAVPEIALMGLRESLGLKELEA